MGGLAPSSATPWFVTHTLSGGCPVLMPLRSSATTPGMACAAVGANTKSASCPDVHQSTSPGTRSSCGSMLFRKLCNCWDVAALDVPITNWTTLGASN